MEEFLIIDPQKNTLRVPAPSTGIFMAIREAGTDNVKNHDSERQLILEVKDFLRQNGVDDDAAGK